jgi:serine/threonine protein kinase
MPLLAGPSLEALMWQKPFSALQTCEWVAQVCRALSAAHSKAIVHGMLRPSSIFVSITDENASLLQLGGFERAILRKALLDGEMYMMGTPSPYDAPEYLFEGKIGPRSDLWAAGMLGYQLVTGRLPYRASGGETLFSMMRGDPPLEFEPTVPIELRNCIARLLRTRHDLRPDSADLVAQELDLVRRSSGNDNYWTYDVAISFAGEDRSLARSLTSALREKNARVFYDEDQAADIWGKNLADYLPEVYRRDARFCIILVSKHYASKAWPNHERRAALDRAIREFDRDYILPIRLDDTNLPGLSESTAYVSASKGIDYISDLVIDKLRRSRPAGGGAWPVR